MDRITRALDEHSACLRGLAQALLGDSQAAEDVLQESWLAAWRARAEPSDPGRWLFGAVRHLALRRRRADERRREREERAARPEGVGGASEPLERRELLGALTKAVLALDEPYQTTLLRRYYEGRSVAEIAAQEGLPLATVKSRLRRALERLRADLDRESKGGRAAWMQGLGALFGVGRRGAGLTGLAGGSLGGLWLMAGTLKIVGAAAAIAACIGWFAWQGWRGPSGPAALAPARTTAVEARAANGPGSDEAVLAEAEQERVELPPPSAAPAAPSTGGIELLLTRARDGAPASAEPVRLVCFRQGAGDFQREGITDERGLVRFEELRPGRLNLESAHGAEAGIEVRAGEVQRIELAIPEGRRVHGRVVDSTGQPVPEAKLWLSGYLNTDTGVVIASAQRDGSFVLEDVPDARYLGAIATGHAPSHLVFLPELAGAEQVEGELEVVLELTGEGGGLVVDLVGPAGLPVVGALVHVQGAPPPPKKVDAMRWLRGIPTFEVRSDGQGRAHLDGLPLGAARVEVRAPGYALASSLVTIELQGPSRLRLALEAEAVVRGRVADRNGQPAVDAQVGLRERGRGGALWSWAVDAEGRFELHGLALGAQAIRAVSATLGKAETELQLAAGEELEWNPVLDRGRELWGEVLDEDERPLAGWWIEARAIAESQRFQSVKSDEHGRYQLTNCKDGALELTLFSPEAERTFPVQAVVLSATEDTHTFHVRHAELALGSLRGRIVGADFGAAEGVTALLKPLGSMRQYGWNCDAQGAFRIEHLPPGDYELELRGADFSGRRWTSVAIGQDELDLGSIVLDPPGSVRVTVAGQSAAECTVYQSFNFREQRGDGLHGWSRHCEASELGQAVALTPGSYSLYAGGAPGWASELATLEVFAQRETVVALEPRAGRELWLDVALPEHLPLDSAVRLRVLDEAGRIWLDDLYPLHGKQDPSWGLDLAAGTYTLLATSEGWSDEYEVEVVLDRDDSSPQHVRAVLR